MARFLLGCGELKAQNRVALVIGNDRYPNLPADRQLQKAVNDARAMGNALQQLGFSVVRGENLSREQIVDHIVRFTRAIKPGDVALVFFAGHGVSLSGANYLLPADIPLPQQGEEIRVRNMALGESDLVADIQAAKPRVLIMVLDACRDNPFRQAGLTRSVGSQAGLSRSREAEGVFTIYSAGFGQAALDRLGDGDRSPNSVFTRVLIPALARTDAHLADIVIDMREEVARLAATIGHEQYPAYYDQTRGGRIYLRPQGAQPAPQAPAVAAAPPVRPGATATCRQQPVPAPPRRSNARPRLRSRAGAARRDGRARDRAAALQSVRRCRRSRTRQRLAAKPVPLHRRGGRRRQSRHGDLRRRRDLSRGDQARREAPDLCRRLPARLRSARFRDLSSRAPSATAAARSSATRIRRRRAMRAP